MVPNCNCDGSGQRGLTQAQIAVAAGLPERSIQRLEAGTGSVGNLMAALAALDRELHPAPANRRKHIRTLNGELIRKREATWSTPTHILEALYSVFTFDLNPCSPPEPNVRCRRWYTEDDDGLAKPWRGVTYMNPPYDAVPSWLAKAIEEFTSGRASKIVGLMPYLPHTSGWKALVRSGAAIFVLEDRLRFGGRKHIAPSCSAICVWGGSAADLTTLGRVLPAHHRVIAAT